MFLICVYRLQTSGSSGLICTSNYKYVHLIWSTRRGMTWCPMRGFVVGWNDPPYDIALFAVRVLFTYNILPFITAFPRKSLLSKASHVGHFQRHKKLSALLKSFPELRLPNFLRRGPARLLDLMRTKEGTGVTPYYIAFNFTTWGEVKLCRRDTA